MLGFRYCVSYFKIASAHTDTLDHAVRVQGTRSEYSINVRPRITDYDLVDTQRLPPRPLNPNLSHLMFFLQMRLSLALLIPETDTKIWVPKNLVTTAYTAKRTERLRTSYHYHGGGHDNSGAIKREVDYCLLQCEPFRLLNHSEVDMKFWADLIMGNSIVFVAGLLSVCHEAVVIIVTSKRTSVLDPLKLTWRSDLSSSVLHTESVPSLSNDHIGVDLIRLLTRLNSRIITSLNGRALILTIYYVHEPDDHRRRKAFSFTKLRDGPSLQSNPPLRSAKNDGNEPIVAFDVA
ncbi:hypothetical protein GMOD_00008708 [Pyrenophora seminiperda CCB06]|uniref:Uncharacterized protein n=1 Tax=Pyrenophora seminiperda CCB06 TaxID=1302712 RepID=A0A3M7M5P0_9PLEO|nr:hypothetical protein GMOD_00008708 [Pyrenophora seminiperda CCB06]